MSQPTGQHREHPSTYFASSHNGDIELQRVSLQDQMTTNSMGGVLSEQIDPTIFRHVLDIGCGAGHWIIDAARAYPTISQLVGIDASSKMVKYASELAEIAGVSDRVEFRVMDALRMLEFPDDSFDLINQRFGSSYLRTWDWSKFLHECERVLKANGVIRLTESGAIDTNSPAYERLSPTILRAFYHSGLFFSMEKDNVIKQLPLLLHQYGFQQVQTQTATHIYKGGTIEGNLFYEDMKHLYQTMTPFIRKWSRVPDDYEALTQQALTEIQQPDFEARWTILTAWGNASSRK